jgi:hypothetical protein
MTKSELELIHKNLLLQYELGAVQLNRDEWREYALNVEEENGGSSKHLKPARFSEYEKGGKRWLGRLLRSSSSS